MAEIPNNIDDVTPLDLKQFFRDGNHLNEHAIITLFHQVQMILEKEPNVFYLSSPITVCGDIHGQILDLFRLFESCGDLDDKNELNETYLFLGDYVDRGYCSIETFAFLALLKVRYPNKIFLLRGNHEFTSINQIYGLFSDCLNLYGHSGIFILLNEVFNFLPIAAVIDNKVFCVHGGLSPQINYIGQISTIDRTVPTEKGPIVDLTWSDPENTSKFTPNRRGNGFAFGANQTKKFLLNNRLIPDTNKNGKEDGNYGFIARSHQLAMDGYAWFHDNNLCIVWSAPNYMYKSGNKATVMVLSNKTSAPIFQFFKEDQESDIKPEDSVIEYFA